MTTLHLPAARLVAVLTAAALGIGAGTVGMRDAAESGPSVLYAEFADASPLIVGNDVKVSGVAVGQVDRIVVRDGRALATLSLDPEAWPVHADAGATIRPVSLLGERFVELDRGTPSEPALDRYAVIPESRTRSVTDLDQVLNAVDNRTGVALAALVTTLGEGMRGQGQSARAALDRLAPALGRADRLARMLSEQNRLLTSLVDRVEPVAGALARDDGRRLDRMLASADLLLRTTRAHRESLERALVELPGTLVRARAALARVAGVASATTPTLAAMRPTTANLHEISAELLRFADAADPALASLEPVLRRAERLLDEAAPLVRALEPAGPDLRAVAASSRPLAEALTDDFRNVLDFVKYWALATNGYDGLSHYFRGRALASSEILTGPLGPGDPPERPDRSLPDPEDLLPPGAPDLPGPPGELGLPGGPGPGGDGGGVTGLTPEQERDALDFLVGGG